MISKSSALNAGITFLLTGCVRLELLAACSAEVATV